MAAIRPPRPAAVNGRVPPAARATAPVTHATAGHPVTGNEGGNTSMPLAAQFEGERRIPDEVLFPLGGGLAARTSLAQPLQVGRCLRSQGLHRSQCNARRTYPQHECRCHGGCRRLNGQHFLTVHQPSFVMSDIPKPHHSSQAHGDDHLRLHAHQEGFGPELEEYSGAMKAA